MVETNYLLCGLLLAPLVGSAGSALWRGSAAAHWPATAGVAVAWVCAGALCVHVAIAGGVEVTLYTWLHFEHLKLNLGLQVDPLTATIIATVTTVALATLLYHGGTVSRGSAATTNLAAPIAEGSYPATVGFLVFAALLTVAADSYLLLYAGWEGVAVSSWLLMGWRTQRLGATTFAVQRLGSMALLLALVILLVDAGSVDFGELATLRAHTDEALATSAIPQLWTIALLLLAVAAAAQAAQFPLHFYLADGSPEHTPTSAMGQAAATVPVGIYLAIRSHHLLSNSADAAVVIAAVALAGALLMAVAALAARDLDRVLAYSTSSQAGLVIGAAVFTSGWSTLHLVTHSLTKGALILAAGLVTRAVTSGGELARMGGLRSHLPLPFWVFVASVAVLSGLPPLMGVWSHAGIALAGNEWATPLFCLVALLTSLSLWRALWLTFLGKARSTVLKPAPSGYSTPVANVALIVLSGLGVVSGFLAAVFLSRTGQSATPAQIDWGPVSVIGLPRLFDVEAQLAVAAIIAAVGLIGPAIVWLVRRGEATVGQQHEDGPLRRLLAEGYYGSEMFELAMRGLRAAARFVWTFVDSLLLDLVCARGLAGTLRGTGWIMARFHSGQVAWYGLAVTAAAFMCALWLLNA